MEPLEPNQISSAALERTTVDVSVMPSRVVSCLKSGIWWQMAVHTEALPNFPARISIL